MRLKQEIVLGIGGWRLLRALGLTPEVNEGHAALAVLERARCYMQDHKKPFDLAMSITWAGNLFTTHTAFSAGFDRFDPALIRKYLHDYAVDELAISVDELLVMGRQNSEDTSEPFNMAYLAVRGREQINGVSKLHGKVSRQIFQPLFPRRPREEVPIGSVTNGIHVPTWDSAEVDALWTSACGIKRWRGDRPVEEDIRQISDQQLWHLRTSARKDLIARMRKRYECQLAAEGADQSRAANAFDQNVLTLGFALVSPPISAPISCCTTPNGLCLLSNPGCPVQLILAGKAHLQDLPGQDLIKEWKDFYQATGG